MHGSFVTTARERDARTAVEFVSVLRIGIHIPRPYGYRLTNSVIKTNVLSSDGDGSAVARELAIQRRTSRNNEERIVKGKP